MPCKAYKISTVFNILHMKPYCRYPYLLSLPEDDGPLSLHLVVRELTAS